MMESAHTTNVEPKRRWYLGRCLLFFWLGVLFDVVGASVLLMGVFLAEPYWDLLLYLGASCCFMSLLWWVFWYTGNIELDPEDARRTPFSLGPSIISLVGTISQSLAFRQLPSSSFTAWLRGPQPFVPTRRLALLSQMVKGKLKGRNGPPGHEHSYAVHDLDIKSKNLHGDDPSSLEAQAGQQGGVGSRFTKRPYSHPGKEAVQPLSATLLVSQQRLPFLLPSQSLGPAFISHSLGAGSARPSLVSNVAGPGQPLSIMSSTSLPTLLTPSASQETSFSHAHLLTSGPSAGGCPEIPSTVLHPSEPTLLPCSPSEPGPGGGHFSSVPP